jgi:Ca2+-binding RTX toxin-like protein
VETAPLPYLNYLGAAMAETAAESSHIDGTAAGNETITAPAGNSSAAGDGGGDLLIGSGGDNTFFINSPKDVVREAAGGGIDTEVAYTSTILASNVENLTVHGDFNNAVGNTLDNLIIVDGSQWVAGLGGNDVLVGSTTQRTTFVETAGQGSDVTISGGSGADLFHGSQDAGIDRVLDFSLSEGDRVELDPGTIYTLSQVGADTVIDMGGANQMILANVQLSALTPGWIFLG